MAFWTWGGFGALGMGAIWTWTQLTPMPTEIKDAIGVLGIVLVMSCLVGWVVEAGRHFQAKSKAYVGASNPYLWLDPEYHDFRLRHREAGAYLPISDVSITLPNSPDYTTLELGIGLDINAIPAVLIDRVDVEIMGKRCPTDWESRQIVGSQRTWLQCDVPSNVNRGKHRVRALAWANGREISTDEIMVDFPGRVP